MKRQLGIVMILIGAIFALAFLGSFSQFLTTLSATVAQNGWTSYAIGYLSTTIFFPVAAFFLIRYGIRFSKSDGRSNQ